MLRLTLYHQLASGLSLYTGLSLLALGWTLSRLREPSRVVRGLELMLIAVGAAGVVLSSVPAPRWLIVVWCLTLLVFLGVHRRRGWPGRAASVSLVLVSLMIVVVDLPYQLSPRPPDDPPTRVTILGDSLSTGIGRVSAARLWPRRLGRHYPVRVRNLSRGGARLQDALKLLETHDLTLDRETVVLEIGGNDLLEGTPPKDFRRRLDALLGRIEARDVLMFELPLPPLGFAYGRIQRRLADQHGVRLIPRRHLSGLLFGSTTTLDGLHFSEEGHRRMARLVARHLGLPR